MIKEIKGTRSEMSVTFDDKVIGFEGELTSTPVFYAVKGTIKNLTNPEAVLNREEKEKIINEIVEYNANQPVKIIFED
jgi:hypothetical protein